MAQIKHTKIRRVITWDGKSTKEAVHIEEYISEMRKYGAQKAKTVRSARHYLRSLGLEIDRNGVIMIKK